MRPDLVFGFLIRGAGYCPVNLPRHYDSAKARLSGIAFARCEDWGDNEQVKAVFGRHN